MKQILILLLFLNVMISHAQNESGKTALLLIDIQYFYFSGGSAELVNPVTAATNAQKLLADFRKSGFPVIHVKHGDGTGAEIYDLVAPLPGEKIIVKNDVNSFVGTDLLEYLRKLEIKNLVICGMQTHMCLEAATRAASDLGYDCVVIHDACATRDLSFGGKTVKAEDVHTSTLATLKAYARVISTEEFLK